MNAGEITITVVGILTPIGTAIAFVWNKVEKRFTSIETKLEECQAREDASQERRGVLVTVAELLWSEVKRLSPSGTKSPTLNRARKLLDDIRELPGLD